MQYSLIATLLTAASLVSTMPTPQESSPMKTDNKTFTINVFDRTSPNGYLIGGNPAPISRSTPITIVLDEVLTFNNSISGDLVIDVCSNYNVDFKLCRCKVLGNADTDPATSKGTYFNATTYGAFAGTRPVIKSIFCTKVQGQWDNRVDQFNSWDTRNQAKELKKEQLLCSKGPVDEYLKLDLFQ